MLEEHSTLDGGARVAESSDTTRAPREFAAPERRLTFLIHGLNYAPDFVGVPKYTTEMAEWLAARGHSVHVETAPPYYPAWKIPDAYEGDDGREFDLNGVTVRRRPLYVPSTPTGRARVVHHASWAARSTMGVIARAKRIKPDIVVAIAPSMAAAPAACAAARLSGAKSWLHVQDFEVEGAAAAGLLSEGWTSRASLAAERRIVRAFDLVSSISPEMVRALDRKGVDASARFELRNWVDTADIAPLPEGASTVRQRFDLQRSDVFCLYAGVISQKQGLETVIDAARRLVGATPIRFAICGEGPEKERLMAMSRDLPNLTWGSFEPVESFAELLGAADIHLLPQLADVADLVLPSKLTAMLSSGRPVVAGARDGTGLAREIEGCGVSVEPEDGAAMANAILRLAETPARRRQLGREARQRAISFYDKESVLLRLEERLQKLVASRAERRRLGARARPYSVAHLDKS